VGSGGRRGVEVFVQRLIFAIALMALFATAPSAQAEGVALTFDDLPTMSLSDDAGYAADTTRALLAGLRRHHVPATGFVIGDKLDGDPGQARLADQWLRAGMGLGNHTDSHLSLNKTPVADYIADVAHADARLRPLLAARHRPLRWFRHPYLETGLTLETRRTFEDWLAADGYAVAPVTMENSDWMFTLPYDEAVLAHDTAGAARIRQAYLDYTAKTVAWYRQAGRQLLGRRPAFVFLLHASRLNADSLDELTAMLRRDHLRPITLDRAMRDPAYRIADAYAGPDGDEWLSRWSRTLGKELDWDSFPEPPAEIAAANDRLDTSP
jgi:peptidoglycan/xylan/chitin deacetylase (PgdA/CDA1 family)